MNKPPNILSEMGAVYSGRTINDWIKYQYSMNTELKRISIDFIRCYGIYGVIPNRTYMILPTSQFPKSSKANGNRDGDYMLKRVGRKCKRISSNTRLHNDNVFYF